MHGTGFVHGRLPNLPRLQAVPDVHPGRCGRVVRVVYLKDALGVHDRRLVAALESRGIQVRAACLQGGPDLGRPGNSGGWVKPGGEIFDFERELESFADILHVGPLPLLEQVADQLGRLPIVAVCWGSDAYQPIAPAALEVLKRSSSVVCDCRCIAGRLEAMGAPADRIASFAWGIDLNTFSPPAEGGGSVDEALFVSTRALEPAYHHEVLLEAFHMALEAGRRGRLCFYGRGSQKDLLLARAQELGVGDLVEFRDPVGEAELADVLRRATAWVNASPTDGYSVSLLQALACGAGVVTTDVECTREAIGPIPAGLFPAGDTRVAADCMANVQRMAPPERSVARRHLAEVADWRKNQKLYVDAVLAALEA